MELNEKVIEYQETRSEVIFAEIYNEVYDNSSNLVESLSRRYRLDHLDVESLINEKIYGVVLAYKNRGNFLNAVRQAVKNGCIDLVRKKERKDKHETEVMIYDETEEIHVEIYEVSEVAPTTSEDDIIEEIQKSLDQRQLVEALVQNADEKVYQTISAFQETDSYRQAAKLVGTCHKTVKSRIRKLSTYFKDSEYGSPSDYFTTPTTRVG